MSGPATPGQDNRRGPMTFWAAAVFQWVNVKGWVMVIGTITAYAAIASFPWNIAIQTALMSSAMGRSRPRPGRCSAVRCGRPDLAARRAGLQHRDGALLLASLYPVFMDA